MQEIAIHRRQFALGPRPLDREGWVSRPINDNFVLSHCQSLEVCTAVDGHGNQWTILGIAVQTEADAPAPIEDLIARPERVEDVVRTWSGRWILIGDDKLRMDAGGLLGCFMRTIEEGHAEGTWVSSSAVLLRGLRGMPGASPTVGDIVWGVGMDWYPPPISRFAGIRRLMVSQMIDLSNNEASVERRSTPVPVVDGRQVAEIINDVVQRLTRAVHDVGTHAKAIPWLALTSGRDSRLLVSAAWAAEIEVRTYTQELPFYRMSRGDTSLPPRLSSELGYEHRLIEPKAFSTSLASAWDEHTGRHTVGADRLFVANRQWQQIPDGVFAMRSNIFGILRRPFQDASLADVQEPGLLLDWIISRWHLKCDGVARAQVNGLREWTEWLSKGPDATLNWRDRFYIEQRCGGWLSSTEQGLDCTAQTSLQLANCSALIADLLLLASTVNSSKRAYELLIEQMAPRLLKYPMNPPDPWYRKGSARVVTEARRMRSRGPIRYAGQLRQRLNRRLRGRGV